jgi:hypothetical protein
MFAAQLKHQILFSVMAVIVMITSTSTVFAQIMAPPAVPSQVMVPAAPQMIAPAPAVPQFMPVGEWNVEKTAFAQTRGLTGVKLPCMMAVSYDNGYVLRLSGNTGQMLAMAVDFRQNVFVQGRKYPATIGLNQLGGNNITATAFSESTLIFNLRPISSFYQQLQGASTLALNVDGNAFVFALGNVAGSIARLESCFGPSAMPMTHASVGEPPMPERKNWNDVVSPSMSHNANTVHSVPSMPSKPMMMSWNAKAGDDLQATLQKWSNRVGVRVDWQSDRGGQVVSDINVNGSFEQAVQLLMAQNATALGVDASMMGHPMSPQSPLVSRRAPQPITPDLRSALPEPSAPSRWSAPAGTNIQLVLQKWSKAEGVEFVWQSHHEFILKSPVQTSNSYEAALQAVLGQFSNDNIRPAAQLNNDPQTGQRILFVQSTRVH